MLDTRERHHDIRISGGYVQVSLSQAQGQTSRNPTLVFPDNNKNTQTPRQDQVLVRLFARLAEPRTMFFPKVIAGLVLETRGLG